MGRPNTGIVSAAPNIALKLKSLRLEKPVQYLSISGNDRGNDWVTRVDCHTDFGQPRCDFTKKLISDGRQIDRTDIDGHAARKVLVQTTYCHNERIINDALKEAVGHD